ncbi:MAG: dTMP kinase [Gemmatimonadota bacterium]|nr:MAG: dTMP kinase [Gemmatimonadota bacterium]
MRGLFITFEGVDGCGKTTQAERLAEYLSSHGRQVVLTREPGGTEISEKIRAVLLDRSNHTMSWLTEMFLYMASRAQLTEEIIRPSLDKGSVVISDRFMDATLAYQGYGRGLDREMIRQLNIVATSKLIPDLTILMDLVPEICSRRMAAMGKSIDRLEGAGSEFQKKVREGYLEMAGMESQRFRVIDAGKSIDENEREIREIIGSLLQ